MTTKLKIVSITFVKALWELLGVPQALEKYLKDKRPTFQEKEIIEAFILLRDSQYTMIEAKLKNLTIQDPLVDAVRTLILGITLNNTGSYREAEKLLERACLTIEKYDADDLLMMSRFNHFICLINLQKLEAAGKIASQIMSMPAENDRKKILQYRVGCTLALSLEKPDQALTFINQIEKYQDKLIETAKSGFSFDKFNYYLQKKDLRKAREMVLEMKSVKKFYHSPNFIFMKNLLDYLIDDKVFYFYEREFEKSSYLWWQVSVLQKLEEKNKKEAKVFWDKLHQISPEIYGPDFKYQGSYCLFNLALKKLNYDEKTAPLESTVSGSKEEQLAHMLKQSESGIRKDDLYIALYGIEPESKNDLDKLKALVTRVRKKSNLEIKSRKGCYYIDPSDKKAS